MREGRTRLFYENLAGIGEFYESPFFTIKQMESILLFQLCNEFAQSRLANIHPMCGTSEVHLFGQNDYSVQMTNFEVGEHSSNPLELAQVLPERDICPTPVKEPAI